MLSLTRRDFLRGSACAIAGTIWLPRIALRAAPLRIGVVDGTAPGNRARRDGITLGIDEANHAAALFGGSVELVAVADANAIVGDGTGMRAGIPYLNVGSDDDALRGTHCDRWLFHVMPSAAMKRDALAAAKIANGRVEAWDPSLERFGADTLNQRFTTKFCTPMTSDAWLAWFAVKALWEASLRARSTDPAKLRDQLARDGMQFDGHKGRPLSFRTWDRQLRQPVYVTGEARVVESPPAAVGDETARESLDRLGVTMADTECRG